MRAGTLHEAAANLKKGKVGVLPTDTLYGLVGLAKDQRAVRAIFRLKKH
jgi:tRNA A37 threonylcarbamoyladenosine synthetase subunit TsaC/SUA5/YrdC